MTRVSYREAVERLALRGFGMKPDLSRISALVESADHPERNYPVIHVAGTNGKSSTSRMIGWILAAHGIKTGIYTSPHLQTVRERFLLAGPDEPSVGYRYISPDEFAETFHYLQPHVDVVESGKGEAMTYFEMTTALAFEWMAEHAAGAAVVETGMGGTWDATNVVRPVVSVITHIALDHEKFLGRTPAEIAGEKAGIIKKGASVVVGRQDSDALGVIEAAARGEGTGPLALGRDFRLISDRPALGGRSISVEGVRGRYEHVLVGLHGAHQSENAAVAIAACEEFLGRALDGAAVGSALSTVRSPGRLEVVGRDPLVILDGAHNPDGARALAKALPESFGTPRTAIVIGVSRDKDARGILAALLPSCYRVILTAGTEKPADPFELAEIAVSLGREGKVVASLSDAVDEAIALSGPRDMVLITGSLYVAGQARDHLLGEEE